MARKQATKQPPATDPPVLRLDARGGSARDGDEDTRAWNDQQCLLDPTRKEALDLLWAVAIRCDTVMLLMVTKAFVHVDGIGDTRLARRLSAALRECETRRRKHGT